MAQQIGAIAIDVRIKVEARVGEGQYLELGHADTQVKAALSARRGRGKRAQSVVELEQGALEAALQPIIEAIESITIDTNASEASDDERTEA